MTQPQHVGVIHVTQALAERELFLDLVRLFVHREVAFFDRIVERVLLPDALRRLREFLARVGKRGQPLAGRIEAVVGAPRVQVIASRGMPINAAKKFPAAFWHIRQWQMCEVSSTAVT